MTAAVDTRPASQRPVRPACPVCGRACRDARRLCARRCAHKGRDIAAAPALGDVRAANCGGCGRTGACEWTRRGWICGRCFGVTL